MQSGHVRACPNITKENFKGEMRVPVYENWSWHAEFSYCKSKRTGTSKTFTVTVLKIKKMFFFLCFFFVVIDTVIHLNDAYGLTNNAYPDQTVPSGVVWPGSALLTYTYQSRPPKKKENKK